MSLWASRYERRQQISNMCNSLIRSCILMPPWKTQVLETSRTQLSKLLQRDRRIRKQKQLRIWIFVDVNCSVMNPIINPMWVDVKGTGNLRERECPFNPPGVGLRAFLKDPVFESNASDR